jgi:transposase-like protein
MLHLTWRGFFMRKTGKTYRIYTEECKESAAKLYKEGNKSYKTLDEELGLEAHPN